MTEQETLYTLALTRVPGLNLLHQHVLLREMGSATAVYEHRRDIMHVLSEANPRIVEALSLMDSLLPRAEEEIRFMEEGQIRCLGINDTDYPARLLECPDAPIALFYRGNADLNARHVVSMVGTRRITEYGRDICRNFVRQLSRLCPDVLVISGLAYGVDIQCHRAALENDLPTVGVLAHGLDQIYPYHHRDDAVRMLEHGGLLTEFMSRTNADKKNFVRRNRIVAGLSDATLVVESASKGGSLITAEIADSYDRDVFAFPGRLSDVYSEGCNELIRRNRASLVSSAESFVESMGWETVAELQQQLAAGIQQDLFPDLSEEEQLVVNTLRKHEELQVNPLAIETGIPVGRLSSLLFTLEMKGVIRAMSGGMYRVVFGSI